MRYVSIILGLLLGAYVIACAVSLVVGAIGVYGASSDPLAMVFAIVLAMPWSMVIGSIGDTNGPAASFALLIVFMAINATILWFARRLAQRAAR